MISSISAIFLTTLSVASYPAADILNEVYYIKSDISGRYLTDRDGHVEVSKHKGSWQQWTVTEVADDRGKYLLKSHRSNFLEDREGDVRMTLHNFDWQEWVFESNGDGTFYIRSHRGEYLRDKSTNWMFWDRGVDVTHKRDTWEKWTLENVAKPLSVENEGQTCETSEECGTGAGCCRQGDALCGERGSPDEMQCTRIPGIMAQIRNAQLCDEEDSTNRGQVGFDECMAACVEENCVGIWGHFHGNLADSICFTCPVFTPKNNYDGTAAFIRDFSLDERRRAEVVMELTAPLNDAHRRLRAAGLDSTL